MSRILPSVVLFLCASLPRARADNAKQKRAKDLWNDGATQYELGRYDEAIVLFRQAYEAWPYVVLQFNLCKTYREKKDFDQATWHCRTYLNNSPDIAPEDKQIVVDLIDDMERLKREEDEVKKRPPTGIDRPDVIVIEREAPPRRDEGPDVWYEREWGWVLSGSGIVLGGVAVGLLVNASALEDELATTPEAERPALREKISTRRTAGIVSAIGGGLALAGGIVIFSWPSGKAKTVSVSLGLGTLFVGGRF
jgi:tetratricopeptide (TPR) repeat protein